MGPGPYGVEFGFGGVLGFGPGWDPAPTEGEFGFGSVSRFPGRDGTWPLRWGNSVSVVYRGFWAGPRPLRYA